MAPPHSCQAERRAQLPGFRLLATSPVKRGEKVPLRTFMAALEQQHPALEAEDLGVGRDISRGRGQPEFREQITGRQFCVESQRDLETFGRRVFRRGAGEGNRTLVCSLGSCRSTIELHPRAAPLLSGSCLGCNSTGARRMEISSAPSISTISPNPSRSNGSVPVAPHLDIPESIDSRRPARPDQR